jgi:hypothetical protein
VQSHGPPDAPNTMTLWNGNRKKKQLAKDVNA